MCDRPAAVTGAAQQRQLDGGRRLAREAELVPELTSLRVDKCNAAGGRAGDEAWTRSEADDVIKMVQEELRAEEDEAMRTWSEANNVIDELEYCETLALAELRQEEAEAEGLDPIDVEFPEWDVPEDY